MPAGCGLIATLVLCCSIVPVRFDFNCLLSHHAVPYLLRTTQLLFTTHYFLFAPYYFVMPRAHSKAQLTPASEPPLANLRFAGCSHIGAAYMVAVSHQGRARDRHESMRDGSIDESDG